MAANNNHENIYDDYIRLQIEGLTRGRELQNAYILVLRESRNKGLYPVLISAEGYESIAAALNKHDFSCSHMMSVLANRLGLKMQGVRLLRPRDGEPQALIDFVCGDETTSMTASASQAAVAALENGVSFWLRKDMFESVVNNAVTGDRMSIPLRAMNDKLIEEAIASAVAEDNYELAGMLHDELQRRQIRSLNNHNDTFSE